MSDIIIETNPAVMREIIASEGGIMKKILCFLLLILLCVGCTNNPAPVGTGSSVETLAPDYSQWQVALLPDCVPMDQGTSEDYYEAAKAWCEEKGVGFRVYELKEDTDTEHVDAIDHAVADGAKVLLLTDYLYAATICEAAEKYPEVYFIALGIPESELQWYWELNNQADYTCPTNLICVTYREEISGYLAGWAAVARGFTKLGILCEYSTPADLRMCYGFLQGADAAAKALGRSRDVSVRYEIINSFCTYSETYSAILDCWSPAGIDTVFVVGNIHIHGPEKMITELLETDGKKLILADISDYPLDCYKPIPEAAVVVSQNNYAETTRRLLTELIENDNWEKYGGTEARLWICSEDPAQNDLGLLESVTLGDGFTEEDYAALIKALYLGELTVSDAIDHEPELSITVIQDNMRK